MVFLLFLTTAAMAAGLCGIAYFMKGLVEQYKRRNDIIEKGNATPAPTAATSKAPVQAAEASA